MTDTPEKHSPFWRTWIQPCVVEGDPEACTVWFAVWPQQFCVTKYACRDVETGEWMRQELEKALANIVLNSHRALVVALRKLSNEVQAVTTIAETAIREEVVNKYFQILCERLNEAHAVLAAIKKEGE